MHRRFHEANIVVIPCKRAQHCCETLRRSQNNRNVGTCCAKSLTSFKLYATSANNNFVVPCKRTQLACLAKQCCVRLYGPYVSMAEYWYVHMQAAEWDFKQAFSWERGGDVRKWWRAVLFKDLLLPTSNNLSNKTKSSQLCNLYFIHAIRSHPCKLPSIGCRLNKLSRILVHGHATDYERLQPFWLGGGGRGVEYSREKYCFNFFGGEEDVGWKKELICRATREWF